MLSGDKCKIENILIEELQGGGLLIKHDRPISKMTIADLKDMKQCLYGALISGKSIFYTGYNRFRSRWEYVPLLEDEIRINGDEVIFEHIGGPNVKHIKDVLQLKSDFYN